MSTQKDQLTEALAGFLNTIFGDAKPKTAADTGAANNVSKAADAAQADADDSCPCFACNLRRLLESKERKAGVKFDMHLSGRIAPQIVERVGGLEETATESKDDKQSMRLAAAVLIACAEQVKVEDSNLAELQRNASEHFEKGIKALNELLASTSAAA